MIIFGWGHTMDKIFGPVIFDGYCPHCHNHSVWYLRRISVWFTLFFIPIFPYKYDRIVCCSICGYYRDVKADDFDKLKPLAKLNDKLARKTISDHEYNMEISRINEDLKSITYKHPVE